MTKPFLIALAVAALIYLGIETAHIGRVFEEKSLNSYALKTSDIDPNSHDAQAHIQGSAAYGRHIALRVAFSAFIVGSVFGVALSSWLVRRSKRAA